MGILHPGYRSHPAASRMVDFPDWVIDYVLVHELAHLAESGHGREFKALLARYPWSERAEGYLIAKAGTSP